MMDQPALERLDDNNTFRILKPFHVSERLNCVAHFITLGAPYWVKSTQPPNVSKSRNTKKFVDEEHDISVKLLHPPPPDTIQEILDVEIDLSHTSPLNKVLEKEHLGILRHLRATMITNHIHPRKHNPFPDMDENDYTQIVEGSLRTVVPLVVFLLLQHWIRGGVDHRSKEFRNAAAILLLLDSSSVIRDELCIPDHTVGGPSGGKSDRKIMSHGNLFALATLDRKSKAFPEYVYADPGPSDPALRSKTKDGLLDDIIEDGRSIRDICQIFKTDKLDTYGPAFKGGWRVDTLHLLGQMWTQCSKCISMMAFFTSVFGFSRVSLLEGNQLYVTRNVTANEIGQTDRSQPAACLPFLKHLTIFVVASIAKGYPEAIPPAQREIYRQLYVTADNLPCNDDVRGIPVVVEGDEAGLS